MDKGLKDDIDYCLTLNAAPVVGIFKDGIIRTWTKYRVEKEQGVCILLKVVES